MKFLLSLIVSCISISCELQHNLISNVWISLISRLKATVVNIASLQLYHFGIKLRCL